MKLARVGPRGSEKPAVELDGIWYDISDHIEDIDGSLLAHPAVLTRHDANELNPIDIEGQRIGPCLKRPGKILCIGLNYRDHALESGFDTPNEPTVFMKAPNSISGPNDPVLMPRTGNKLDWELELAVVIGSSAQYLTNEREASNAIAGYAISNDVSERSSQLDRGGQWVKGKSFETFNPLGPWIVTPDELDIEGGLAMNLAVNGKPMQSGNTREMIFSPAHIVWYLSQFMLLEPGDVINTGTPAGVGLGMSPPTFLKVGDVVDASVEGLGTQTWTVHEAS